MRDVDLYEFLEDVSGVKLYEQKKDEALQNIESVAAEKEEIVKFLKELSHQIKQLEDERETFKGLGQIQ
jgi:chromosome segregation ATPase